MRVERKKLVLSREVGHWLATVSSIAAVRFVPVVDPAIAVQSVALPDECHQDPADRMIVATTRRLAAGS